ncbi:hypothetical protein [Rhodococcus rhodochrous]|uniref:hypothetical protein n=1 Tax=Rhodococcus rhodochrous TaxID=1829 RepID=UPI00177B8AEE|nr:hypothetical protein [Rhodococcus rhodochrous]QOH59852.1 hypothetical protein C6Y44_27555 [Rhodococcus rhodochrous]
MTIRHLTTSELESVYLDGFCSGIATSAVNSGCDQEQADAIADYIASSIRDDENAMSVIRQQIVERLTGVDNGAVNVEIKTDKETAGEG